MLNTLKKLNERARQRKEWRNAILLAIAVLTVGTLIIVGVISFFGHFYLW